jgi:ribonuclease Z
MGEPELPRQETVQVGRLTLAGYSRSTVATYLVVPELSILFDAGACSPTAAAAADAFVTHLHIDHAQALPTYASQRNMLRLAPGRIHVPAGTGAAVRAWIDGIAALQGPEGGRFDYEVDELAPGDSRELRGRYRVQAFATDHFVPSLGFTVFERREKLRPEYQGLPSDEIGRRKRAGEPLTRRVEIPLVTYVGDTSPRALDAHPEVGESEVLVLECTFLLAKHRENARETKHLHIRDLVERADLLRSPKIVLTHFSMRYKRGEVEALVRQELPGDVRERVALLL